MLDYSLLKNLLLIATIFSPIMMAFIQKTKRFLPNSNLIPLYSLIVALVGSYFFSLIFIKNISLLETIWIGLFSFLGADTIYAALEGKLLSYSDIVGNNSSDIKGEIEYE